MESVAFIKRHLVGFGQPESPLPPYRGRLDVFGHFAGGNHVRIWRHLRRHGVGSRSCSILPTLGAPAQSRQHVQQEIVGTSGVSDALIGWGRSCLMESGKIG